MYSFGFREYINRPATSYCIRKAYVDTADTGDDYLCGIVYDETDIGNFVVDVIYTQKPMEYTETATAHMLSKHMVAEAWIESNNGGRGFARNVERQMRQMGNNHTRVKWFAQTDNKDVRILSIPPPFKTSHICPKVGIGCSPILPCHHGLFEGGFKHPR